MEYMIAKAETTVELTKIIAGMIEQGYRPQGGLCRTGVEFMQAMTRTEIMRDLTEEMKRQISEEDSPNE